MWTAIGAAVSFVTSIFNRVFGSESTAERLGEATAHREQEEDTRRAEDRMDSVAPADPKRTRDGLRRGKF